jgi:hypothetical protein
MPAELALLKTGGQMVMPNGAGQHAAASSNGGLLNGDPTVVHVNFGLKPRHIYAILAGVPAGLAALGAAGYAVLPASKAEVEAVQQGFHDLKTHVTAEIKGLKDVDREMVVVLREMKDAVAELRNAPRLRVAPAQRPRPAPKPAAPGGLLDF